MRRNWFYILLSLSERDRHGSGIMRDVRELTRDALTLWPATLYGALDELVDEGWVRVLATAPPDAIDGEAGHRSKWFRITASGRKALSRELESLEAVVRAARQRLAPTQ